MAKKVDKSEMTEIVVRRVPAWKGLSAAAKRLGVTHTHMHHLLNGTRTKKDLDQILATNRITVVRD